MVLNTPPFASQPLHIGIRKLMDFSAERQPDYGFPCIRHRGLKCRSTSDKVRQISPEKLTLQNIEVKESAGHGDVRTQRHRELLRIGRRSRGILRSTVTLYVIRARHSFRSGELLPVVSDCDTRQGARYFAVPEPGSTYIISIVYFLAYPDAIDAGARLDWRRLFESQTAIGSKCLYRSV